MRKSAQPIFDLLVQDERFETFSVKDLREIANKATSALVNGAILKKFQDKVTPDSTVEDEDWETRLFARIRAAGEAANDPGLIHDLYMMMHLRD